MTKKTRGKLDFAKIFFGVCLLALALYFVIGMRIRNTDYKEDENSAVYASDFEWYCLKSDGTWNQVEMPYSPKAKAGELTTLKTTLPDKLQDNMVLAIRPDKLNLYVEIDGIKRAFYSTDTTRYIGKTSCKRYIFMPINEVDEGKEMTVRLTTTVAGLGRFETQNYGPKSEVVASLIQDNITDIIIAAIMLIVSILCFVFGLILKIGFKTDVELNYISTMSMLASLWILCNSEISQMYFSNASLSSDVSCMCLMLMPFPFLLYVDAVQDRRFTKIISVLEYITILEIVAGMIFALAGIFDFSQMYLVVAGVLGVTLIIILVLSYIDIIKYKNLSYMVIALGILAAAVATLIQIAHYMSGHYKYGAESVGIALLIMLVTAIYDTFRKVKRIALEKQVAIAEREAESHFLASMSHEIRTPINAVLGMNEMILRESNETHVKEYAKNIERSGNMLLSLVNDILDFSKINSGKMDIICQNYSLMELIKDVGSMVSPRAKLKNLDFKIEVDKETSNDLYGDDVRIKQIMVNFLTNAVKYTDSGTVTLKVNTEETENERVNLNISVSDTGRGISDEGLDKLFDAFQRVDEKKNRNIEGTGLGLALVKQLAGSMDGTVNVESKYGSGSTFSVTIPQTKTSSRTVGEIPDEISLNEHAEKEASSNVFESPNARILIVDDTKMNIVVMKGLLKRNKVKTYTAESALEAIELLKNNSYDLIFMDHRMPGMDGEEALAVIKEEKLAPGVPVIVLTANAVAGMREHYMEIGFDEYLSKPVRPAELEKLLRHFLSNLDGNSSK